MILTPGRPGCSGRRQYTLALAAVVPGAGSAVDRLGRRVFTAGLAPFTATRERADAVAAFGATIGFAFAAGSAAGGVLTSGLGWHAVFCISVPLG